MRSCELLHLFVRRYVPPSFLNESCVRHSHNVQNLLKFRTRDITVVKELRYSGTHREVHVQLTLGLLQGELAAAEEGHDALVICRWNGMKII